MGIWWLQYVKNCSKFCSLSFVETSCIVNTGCHKFLCVSKRNTKTVRDAESVQFSTAEFNNCHKNSDYFQRYLKNKTREKCQEGYRIFWKSLHSVFLNSNLKFTHFNICWSSFKLGHLVLSESAKQKLMMITKQQKRGTLNVTLSSFRGKKLHDKVSITLTELNYLWQWYQCHFFFLSQEKFNEKLNLDFPKISNFYTWTRI